STRSAAASQRALMSGGPFGRHGARPQASAAGRGPSSTTAIVSVGQTLQRPSVSAIGGSESAKRAASAGPSTVDSVYRPHMSGGLDLVQAELFDRLLAQLELLDLAGDGEGELAHAANVARDLVVGHPP